MKSEQHGSTDSEASASLAVEMRGITKRFPGVIANENADLLVRRGEIHGLLGENGAGKSTLSNCLTGLYRPEEGLIRLWGEQVALENPKDAIGHGVGMVHQHFHLVQTFTVAENLSLGHSGPLRLAEAEQRVSDLADRFGLPVDPRAHIWELTVGEQQRVEILKALDHEAKILILDEPTAVLTPQEAQVLFETLRSMAADGRSVIFISHKLDEVIAVSDRITVLRDGTDVGVVETKTTTAAGLATLMVGREVVFNADDSTGRSGLDASRVVLEIEGLSSVDSIGTQVLDSINLEVRAGEIVAVCGVSGNGQRDLARAICGTGKRTAGEVRVEGKSTQGFGARAMSEAGVAYVPESRLSTGLAPSATVEENLILKSYRRPPVSKGVFIDYGHVRSNALDLIEKFGIKTPGPETPTRLLSGGNVQKVLLAREFSADPKVLIAAAPTRGLDVGAIETVRGLLLEQANSGVGVLLITEDLDEALALSDRIGVMYEGTLSSFFDSSEADVTEIGLLMGGKKGASKSNA